MVESINLEYGKYEIQVIDDGKEFKCLRHGKEWRDLCGDGMVMAMFYRILELEEENKKLKRRIKND